jgi:hypothetical protein
MSTLRQYFVYPKPSHNVGTHRTSFIQKTIIFKPTPPKKVTEIVLIQIEIISSWIYFSRKALI